MDCPTPMVSCPVVSPCALTPVAPPAATTAVRPPTLGRCEGHPAPRERGSLGDLVPCPWWPWTSLGATQLSRHPWKLLTHRTRPEPLQLQTGMFKPGSQVGRSWLWHSPAASGARGRRSKGAAPSVSLSFPWPVPDLALTLCCDCRPQARRDRSRHPGRKGRIPHRDRYAPTPQPRRGNWHGHGRGPRTLSPCWPLDGVLGTARLSGDRSDSLEGSSTSHRRGGQMLAGVGPQGPCGVGEMRWEGLGTAVAQCPCPSAGVGAQAAAAKAAAKLGEWPFVAQTPPTSPAGGSSLPSLPPSVSPSPGNAGCVPVSPLHGLTALPCGRSRCRARRWWHPGSRTRCRRRRCPRSWR